MESSEKLFEYLKKAAADLQETRRRLRKLEAGAREPVAVVGMGCRFRGGVRGPEELWELVATGTDAVSEFPADRGWDVAGIYDSGPGSPLPTRQGGVGYDAAGFCAGVFGGVLTMRSPAAPRLRVRAGSCMTRRILMRGSSGSARGRRWRCIRSSGCCSRFAGRPWSGPGSIPGRCAAA